MITLPIISIILCIAYIVFVLFKYGVPGIYWFTIAPNNLKWVPITVVIALLLVGAACCYKSGPKTLEGYEPPMVKGDQEEKLQPHYYDMKPSWIKELWWKLVDYLKSKFNPKVFFKYPARVIHYVNSLIAIILSTIYLCMTCGPQAIAGTIISYIVWILIGMKVDGVYNPDYSLDVNNKAWIFFMEIICFVNLFVFIWK